MLSTASPCGGGYNLNYERVSLGILLDQAGVSWIGFEGLYSFLTTRHLRARHRKYPHVASPVMEDSIGNQITSPYRRGTLIPTSQKILSKRGFNLKHNPAVMPVARFIHSLSDHGNKARLDFEGIR